MGSEALAGVSAAMFLIWCAYSAMDVSMVGINTLVSQNIGAGNLGRANRAGTIGIIIGLIAAFFVMIVGLTAYPTLFRFMDLAPGTQDHASQYFIWFILGISATFTWRNFAAIFRGSGDTLTPMRLIGFALILNIILDPLFMVGFGWGTKGCAIATVLTHLIIGIIGARILRRRGWSFGIQSFYDPKDDLSPWTLAGKIIRIGIPMGLTGFIFSLVYIFLARIISQFGTAPMAAIGIGHRIESIVFLACMGFSTAAATLVGQNLGAGKIKKAEESAWKSVFYLTLVLTPISLIFILLPEQIMTIFTDDLNVIREGADYLKIIGVSEIFMGAEIVLLQSFGGAGYTLIPTLISVPLTVARLPLAYFLAIYLGYGPSGIWWAVAMTSLVKGTTLGVLFKLGLWKRK